VCDAQCLFITADSFFASRSRLEMNIFAHILCKRMIGGRAVNPRLFLGPVHVAVCNTTEQAEVHNLPTLEKEG
jgi:hypothetical protein